MPDPDLPIHTLLPALREQLAATDALIIEAPPGAGKTTQVPLALLREPWLAGRRIVMLQPRRLAARNAAQRMAELLGEQPGETVGYRMRLDSRVGPRTVIEVVTEGVLLRMLREDPSLESVGLLIFDEIHERSLEADLGLALVLHARETFGAEMPLKLLAMSATLDADALAALLAAPVLRSEGRLHPVEIRYGRAKTPRERITERVTTTAEEALRRHGDSSVLAFLPGQAEIRRVADSVNVPPNVTVHPLYGDLDLARQRQAIAASPPGQRKLVLATNIAETSLTIDGVDVVIDSGLARAPAFDPGTGMSRLHTVRISRAASEQRAGRAGRLRPGVCYRLWSEAQQSQLAPQDEPEIRSADLAPLALQLFAWGVQDPGELRWLTPPPAGAWAQAVDLLTALGALRENDGRRRLTDHGDTMATLPLHPRLAHLLLCGRDVGALRTASGIAAVLSERDPLGRESPDMRLRLDYLGGERDCPGRLRGWLQRTRQLAERLRREVLEAKVTTLERPAAEQLPGYLIACAYPERIARRRHSGGYQLANGRGAQFDAPDALGNSKWLAVAEVGGRAGRRGDSIRSAAPLDPALFETVLAAQIEDATVVDWDERAGRFIAERQRRCGALLLARSRIEGLSDEARVGALLRRIRDDGLQRLNWAEPAQSLLQRAQLMQTLDDSWPAFAEAALLEQLEDWLAPYVATVKRLTDLRRVDLAGALRARLSWEQQQRLDTWLPTTLTVPSGSRVRIDYGSAPPVLAVKLQEMFGCESTPAVAQGRLPLQLQLLSPAGRPLQVTQDLAGFWRSAYADVRREMKGRYPKHPWPEDPLNAVPTRHTKARQR